ITTELLITDGSSNRVQGNYIGTDASGGIALGTLAPQGMTLEGGTGNIIGGTTPATPNVIISAGYPSDGTISVYGSASNRIMGNFIGTDASGSVALGSSPVGILIQDSTGNTIGGAGAGAGAGNIIAQGIEFSGGSDNLVQGNSIGTDPTGTLDFGD